MRQTQQYCGGDFATWDPMITTFPGLYVVAVGLLQPVSVLLGQPLTSSGSWLCSAPVLRVLNPMFGLLVFFCSADIIDSIGRDTAQLMICSVDNQPAYERFKQLKASRGRGGRRASASPTPQPQAGTRNVNRTIAAVDGTWGALTLSLCPLHFFFVFLL